MIHVYVIMRSRRLETQFNTTVCLSHRITGRTSVKQVHVARSRPTHRRVLNNAMRQLGRGDILQEPTHPRCARPICRFF